VTDSQPEELKHAYRVMDVPTVSTSYTIKQRYRQMMKRWHPDLYSPGSPEHAEATQMTASINDAFSKIERAPLRYYREPQSPFRNSAARTTPPVSGLSTNTDWDPCPFADRCEFWIRFVLGAVFGAPLGIRLWVDLAHLWNLPRSTFLLALLTTSVVCALASARGGDKVWHSMMRMWWWRPWPWWWREHCSL